MEEESDAPFFTRYHILEWLSHGSMTVEEIIGRAARESPGVSIFTWNSVIIPMLETMFNESLIDYAAYEVEDGIKRPKRYGRYISYKATDKGLQLHDDVSSVHNILMQTLNTIKRFGLTVVFIVYTIADLLHIVRYEHKYKKTFRNNAEPPLNDVSPREDYTLFLRNELKKLDSLEEDKNQNQ